MSKIYQNWFSWLMASPNKHDSRIRFAVTMRVLKEQYMCRRIYCRRHLNDKVAVRVLTSEPLKNILPPRISEKYPLLNIPKILVGENFDGDIWLITLWVRFCSWFAILFLIPFVGLSIIYNVLYP